MMANRLSKGGSSFNRLITSLRIEVEEDARNLDEEAT
jgi:hypothetical protein